MIKLNAKITGEKVHDVGYRVFLLRKALELGFKGFNAYNDFDREQIIIIQAEGDAHAVQAFKSFAEKKAPEHALVSERIFEDFDGYVMSISDYMHLLQVEQLSKGIPAIISIDKKQDKVLEKQDKMLEKQDKMLEKQDKGLEKQDRMLEKQDRMLEKQDTMLEKQDTMLEKQDTTINEIKGVSLKIDQGRVEISGEIRALRDDFKSHIDERLTKMEFELVEIKAKIAAIQYTSPSQINSSSESQKAK